VSTPRDFFNDYVKSAVADCEAEPGAAHRAGATPPEPPVDE
jgi:hypothetical protein